MDQMTSDEIALYYTFKEAPIRSSLEVTDHVTSKWVPGFEYILEKHGGSGL